MPEANNNNNNTPSATRDSSTKRPSSRSRTRAGTTTPSRPTTPLRASSRSSFRSSARDTNIAAGITDTEHADDEFPLDAFEPGFAELADAVADLEANMMHFQLMHESLARFSESFASFMYGLNMNAFCVEFPEGPIPESFRWAKERDNEGDEPVSGSSSTRLPERTPGEMDGETTFMTTDTSFVDNPASGKPTPKFQTPQPRGGRQSRVPAPSNTRGAGRGARGGGIPRGSSRPSGLARPRGRGIR